VLAPLDAGDPGAPPPAPQIEAAAAFTG